jgi:hypothetical protein
MLFERSWTNIIPHASHIVKKMIEVVDDYSLFIFIN